MKPEIDYSLGSYGTGGHDIHYLSKCGKYVIWNFDLSYKSVKDILRGYKLDFIDWIHSSLAKRREQKINKILDETGN
jgi:hypothetical protein